MKDSTEIFAGTSVSDMFEKVYQQALRSNEEIQEILDTVKPLIEDPTSAAIILPMLTELIKSRTKDNEILVKLLAVQTKYEALKIKSKSSDEDEDDEELSDEDKKLLELINK